MLVPIDASSSSDIAAASVIVRPRSGVLQLRLCTRSSSVAGLVAAAGAAVAIIAGSQLVARQTTGS